MKRNQGFTLLEVIIYIGLFGILMSGVIIAARQLLSGGDRNQLAIAVQEEGTFLSRKINWALTDATSIAAPSNDTLIIIRPELDTDSPLTIQADGNSLTIARGTGAPIALNSSQFPVSNVTFTVQAAVGDAPAAVTTQFQVQNIPFIFKQYLRR